MRFGHATAERKPYSVQQARGPPRTTLEIVLLGYLLPIGLGSKLKFGAVAGATPAAATDTASSSA